MRIPRLLIGLAGIVLSSAGLPAQQIASPQNWPVPKYVLYSVNPGDADPGLDALDKQMDLEKALPTAASSFVGITPCRMADTRGGGFGGAYGPPALTGSPRDFVLTGRCGVPANAVAVSLNLTVVVPAGDGFLAAFPTAGQVPLVSTLNFRAGQVLANAAIVPLGSGGAITRFTSGASTDLLIDVNGYFAPPPTAQKLCASINQDDHWIDTIAVPAAWTAAMCNNHRIQWTGTNGPSAYALGCLTDTGISWGSQNGGLPSPNCGW